MKLVFDLERQELRPKITRYEFTSAHANGVVVQFVRDQEPVDVDPASDVAFCIADKEGVPLVAFDGVVGEPNEQLEYTLAVDFNTTELGDYLGTNLYKKAWLGIRVEVGSEWFQNIPREVIVWRAVITGSLTPIPPIDSLTLEELQTILLDYTLLAGDTMTGPLSFAGDFAPLILQNLAEDPSVVPGGLWRSGGLLKYFHEFGSKVIATTLDLLGFVSVDEAQEFDETQKAKGRENIGISGWWINEKTNPQSFSYSESQYTEVDGGGVRSVNSPNYQSEMSPTSFTVRNYLLNAFGSLIHHSLFFTTPNGSTTILTLDDIAGDYQVVVRRKTGVLALTSDINGPTPEYASDAAATADSGLDMGKFYRLTGEAILRQKQ